MARQMDYRLVLTGQHEETMQDLIDAFAIRPADDILVKRGESDTHIKVLKWFALALRAIKNKQCFSSDTKIILTHGDTLSTLLGAVAGRCHKIPVGHVEAGLRSFNYFHPFPEEIIRVITSRLATCHFCSGDWAAENINSKTPEKLIINTRENTILDALRFAIAGGGQTARFRRESAYAIVSMHRHENLSDSARFNHILETLEQASETIRLKFILHPVTENKLNKSGWYKKLAALEKIELLNRMNYVDFAKLLVNARLLMTDGGSNQEEALHMGLPCLLLRKKTERVEGLSSNVVISNYRRDIILRFVAQHANNDWPLKALPEVYPSKIIVDYLQSI